MALVLAALVWSITICGGVVPASEWSSTEVHLLHGEGFRLGDEVRDILTLTHASGWSYGSNFFFFDIAEPFAAGTDVYGEWYTRLSLRRILACESGWAFVDDLSFAASINAGSCFRAYLWGSTLHFSIPGFSFCNLDVMVYDNLEDTDITFILIPAWDVPITVGPVELRFRGFVDVTGAEGDRVRQILAQPQLLLDVGHFLGKKGQLLVGMEYEYYRNKFGIDGEDESFPQAMVAWSF